MGGKANTREKRCRNHVCNSKSNFHISLLSIIVQNYQIYEQTYTHFFSKVNLYSKNWVNFKRYSKIE